MTNYIPFGFRHRRVTLPSGASCVGSSAQVLLSRQRFPLRSRGYKASPWSQTYLHSDLKRKKFVQFNVALAISGRSGHTESENKLACLFRIKWNTASWKQLKYFVNKLQLYILQRNTKNTVKLNKEEPIDWLYKFHCDIIVQEKNVCIACRPKSSILRPAGHPKLCAKVSHQWYRKCSSCMYAHCIVSIVCLFN